ncbi:MAG: L-fucose/L-arabinose isomerase family protein [Alphaproteobacteria bacterium]
MSSIGVLALGRPTFDVEFAQELLGEAREALTASGHEIIGGETLLFDADATVSALDMLKSRDLDLVLILQVTFTDASMTVRIASELNAPLALWAFPEPRLGGRLRLNAFCGLNLAAHALGLNDTAFSYAYSAPGETDVKALLADFLSGNRQASPRLGEEVTVDTSAVNAAIERLKGKRIGRIGERPDGFDTCRYNANTVEHLTGVKIDEIELDDLFQTARTVPAEAISASRNMVSDLGGLAEVDQPQLDRSLALHGALQDMQKGKDYSAFAIRCWPETFTEYGGAVCGPVGMMGESKIPCACEADVYGALTNLLVQELTGLPPFLVDLVDLDEASETGVVWHCGQAPISMCDPEFEPQASIHSNRKMPLLFEFPLKPGRVTLARISQARGKQSLFLATGNMQTAPLAFSGTAGVMQFDAGIKKTLKAVMDAGLEHHTTLAYGDHAETLTAAASALGLPVIMA